MSRLLLLLTLGAALALAAPAFAGPPWLFGKPWGTPPCGCCPDDYCRKKLPPVPPAAPCGCVDEYCRKKLPPVPPAAPCGCVDDYCRKKLPVLLPQLCGPWYTCSGR